MSKEKDIKDEKPERILTDAEKIDLYEKDPIASTFFTVSRKMNELNISFNATVIDVKNEEDKVFERFMRFVEKGEEAVGFLLFLENKVRERFKVEDTEQAKGAKQPILEDYVKNKMNVK